MNLNVACPLLQRPTQVLRAMTSETPVPPPASIPPPVVACSASAPLSRRERAGVRGAGLSVALSALVFAMTLLLPCAAARADLFEHLGDTIRAIAPPPTAPGSFGVSVDALPDGRLVAVTGFDILLETAPGAGVFQTAATIDPSLLASPTDPSFLVVSPTGARVALGAGFGKPVLVFDTVALNPTSPTTLTPTNTSVFLLDHFAAAWLDDDHLAIAAGVFGQPSFVSLLDVTSDPLAPTDPVIVSNIDGASAGVCFDADGYLYTGNGFDNSPGAPGTSETGFIKAFSPTLWNQGADFETQGDFIADILSAGALRFDRQGDLFVGGGDFSSGDTGDLAVVHAAALADARSNRAPIDTSDPNQVKRIDPIGDGSGFFSAIYNPAVDELLITDFTGWFATSGRRPGDLTGDGVVNGADLATLLVNFGSNNVFADLNADGVVDGADLATLLVNFGADAP